MEDEFLQVLSLEVLLDLPHFDKVFLGLDVVDGVLFEDLVASAVLVDSGRDIDTSQVFFEGDSVELYHIQPKLLVPYFFTFVTLGSPTN